MNERRHPLTDDDIDKIAEAVTIKTRESFHIEEEKHYNSHQKLDKMLEAYDSATNIFWKMFLALVITGSIVLAGLSVVKGVK